MFQSTAYSSYSSFVKYGKRKNSPVFEKTGQGGDVWVSFPIALDAIRELFK